VVLLRQSSKQELDKSFAVFRRRCGFVGKSFAGRQYFGQPRSHRGGRFFPQDLAPALLGNPWPASACQILGRPAGEPYQPKELPGCPGRILVGEVADLVDAVGRRFCRRQEPRVPDQEDLAPREQRRHEQGVADPIDVLVLSFRHEELEVALRRRQEAVENPVHGALQTILFFSVEEIAGRCIPL